MTTQSQFMDGGTRTRGIRFPRKISTGVALGLVSLGLTSLWPLAGQSLAAQHSELWGERGENWTPVSRLPDFSHAGYQRGERPLPVVSPGVSVTEFGANGSDDADDTQAFLAALAKVKQGAIEIPPGRYIITNFLQVSRPNVVLRGAGPDQTILFFPKPLNDIKPNWGETTTGKRTSNYSWSGGFVVVQGQFGSEKLTSVTPPAARGDQTISVTSVDRLRVGQEVEIYQQDTPTNSLAVQLYGGDSGPVDKLLGRARMSLVTRITAINRNRVTFDRPLRCDLHAEWQPQLRVFAPTVTESGIENMGFEFPPLPYAGHFTELGFNAAALHNVAHCWIRNIRVRNADSGAYVTGYFNTIDGAVFESARAVDQQNCTGHHGLSISAGGDNLVRNFDFQTRIIHDVTVSRYTSGNVVERGRGVELSLDHHRYAPNENLFTDLDAGTGRRLWKCGGGDKLGYHCGARGTFWNIRASKPMSYPPAGFGPASINVVGLFTTNSGAVTPDGKWFEPISPADLQPQNLHEAQLARRLAATK